MIQSPKIASGGGPLEMYFGAEPPVGDVNLLFGTLHTVCHGTKVPGAVHKVVRLGGTSDRCEGMMGIWRGEVSGWKKKNLDLFISIKIPVKPLL